MTKSSENVSAKENFGIIFLYISTIKIPEEIRVSITKPRWRIVVDERKGINFSDLLHGINVIIELTFVQFRKWKRGVQSVRFVRRDNSGDNFKLEQVKNGKHWKIDINFE